MADPTDALRRVISGADLGRAEMEELIGALMDGELEPPLQAALLAALATKGESVDEIAGAAAAMRRRAVPVAHRRPEAVDTCGTGGDGKGTFNISTAAAIVAAAAGVPVAKHGNRSVSSRSGSADVLEALGVAVQQTPERAAAALDAIGIAFLFAPGYHPAMKQVMPVRRALGVRTLFNVLGPLTNPAGARRQLLGVYAPHLVERLAAGAGRAGQRARPGGARRRRARRDHPHRADAGGRAARRPRRDPHVRARGAGLRRGCRAAALAGGDPADNAAALERMLAGEPGPLAEVTVLNAGAAVYVGGLAEDLRGGVERARRALASGAAGVKLDELRRVSGDAG